MQTKTIDLTPTWSEVLPAILAVVGNEGTPFESRKVLYEELERMASYADKWVAHVRAEA